MTVRPGWLAFVALASVAAWQSADAAAQRGGRGGEAGPRPPAARSAPADAPFDPTGYWVSIVSDEWRYRMLTPPKGNVDYVPVSAAGRRAAESWDPSRDEANGEACRGYGAGGIMRLPGRLHITWQDDNTLRIDIDTGTQTRLLHFGESPSTTATPDWQGYSVAQWERAGGPFGPPPAAGRPRPGQLKIVTTRMRPGYLRKNGVPYSAAAVLTEHVAHLTDDDGTRYLAITSMLEDPEYLLQPWVRTSQFKRVNDSRGWNPTACVAQ